MFSAHSRFIIISPLTNSLHIYGLKARELFFLAYVSWTSRPGRHHFSLGQTTANIIQLEGLSWPQTYDHWFPKGNILTIEFSLESPLPIQSSCLNYWTCMYSDIVFRSFFLFKTLLIWQFEWYTKCLMLLWFHISLSLPKLYIARLRLCKVNYHKTVLKHCSIYNQLYVWISCCYNNNNNGMVYSNIKIYKSNTFVLSALWITKLFFLWSTVLAFWLRIKFDSHHGQLAKDVISW